MNINGKPLICPHCQGTAFEQQSAQLNTRLAEFFDLSWLNKSADTFICRGCGRIEWFVGAYITHNSVQFNDRDCQRCGCFISASLALCPNCGNPAPPAE